MKKKVVTLCLVLALAAIAIAGGTIAYFTDTDEATNTFTVGDVKIDLIESQYHRVNAGKANTVGMEEPLQGACLWAPDVELSADAVVSDTNYTWTGLYFSDAEIKADAATYENGYFKEHSQNMVPGSNVRKNPYVINKGKNDAYVRVRVLVPVTLFDVLDNGPSYWTTTAMNEGAVTSEAVDYYNAHSNQPDPDSKVKRVNAKGVEIEYYEFDFTYTKVLKAGAMTFWNVWGNIAIDPKTTSERLADVDSFDVIFEADAIQAKGFATAADAFAAFDAE